MSTLNSSSTDAEVAASYDDNASYAEDNSVSKARAFITACRLLLRRRPSSLSQSGRSVAFDAGLIRKEMDEAKDWLSDHSDDEQDAGPRVTGVDFRDFR